MQKRIARGARISAGRAGGSQLTHVPQQTSCFEIKAKRIGQVFFKMAIGHCNKNI